MTRIASVLPSSLIVLLTPSCAGPPPAPPEPTEQRSSAATHRPDASVSCDELEKLRALGYLDTTGIPKAGPGGGVTIVDPEAAYDGDSLVVFAIPCRAELLFSRPAPLQRGEVVRRLEDPRPDPRATRRTPSS